jgi:hypothetical protein
MESRHAGELVKVAGAGPAQGVIVFDVPSGSKVVVAVVDPERGPVFRSFPAKALTERTEEGPQDRALRLLIRRTPPPVHGAARAGAGAVRGSRGHKRATMHRTTGK